MSYLNMKFPLFLNKIGLIKEVEYADSIISCDADKCSQYYKTWEENGISKTRGTMLYLITKSRPYCYEAREGIPVHQWVINNYHHFKQIFDMLQIE